MENRNVEISVIVPVYNVEKYVVQCVRSIMEQTLRDLEIIIIDDGSTDTSGELINALANEDERIRVIHKGNQGYGNTVNMGLKLAKGKYVGIIESDDYIKKDMYERLFKMALETDADVVKGTFYAVFEDDYNKDDMFAGMITGECTTPKENKALFYASYSIWSAIYKKEFLEKNDILFLETPGASYQDISFAFKVWCMASKIVLIDEPLVYYRTDNPNSSVKSTKKIFAVCDEIREIERFLEDKGLNYGWYSEMKDIRMVWTYLWNFRRLHPEIRYAFYRIMVEEIRHIDLSSVHKANWPSECLKSVEEIQEDEDKFFWVNSEQFWKDDLDKKTIIGNLKREAVKSRILQENKIVIYGAGIRGKRMLQYIRKMGAEEKVLGFAVTNQPKEARYIGKDVCSIDAYDKDSLIIVSVKDMFAQRDILNILSEKGFEKVLRMDKEWFV